jgi:hypothetical protein
MNRIELETKLNDGRNWILDKFVNLSASELNRPLTPSEHDPDNVWTPLDHFAHLALIERDFVAIARRHIDGAQDPVTLLKKRDGKSRSREEIMAAVHAMTEKWQLEHHGKSLDEVVALTSHARANTLNLIAELSDAQLQEKIPGAPWADGTIAGVLGANADHGRGHWKWLVEAGLDEPPPMS